MDWLRLPACQRYKDKLFFESGQIKSRSGAHCFSVWCLHAVIVESSVTSQCVFVGGLGCVWLLRSLLLDFVVLCFARTLSTTTGLCGFWTSFKFYFFGGVCVICVVVGC